MKCHLNRMTAALLALVLLTIPALALQAAPATETPSVSVEAEAGLFGFWHRLLAGLSTVFAGDETQPDDENNVNGSFDPDGFTMVDPEDGETNVNGSFDPDG